MSKRTSKPNMSQSLDGMPPLAQSYINAINHVCDRDVQVHNKYFRKLLGIQHKLDDLDVSYDDYAYSVVNTWWPWCKSKHMSSVPINVFCGAKAWNRFIKQHNGTVRIDKPSDDEFTAMVQDELTVAKYYIAARNSVTFRQARNALAPYLPTIMPVPPRKVADAVVKLLAKQYDCPDAKSYDDIIRALIS